MTSTKYTQMLKNPVLFGKTASEVVGRSVAIGWQHPTVEIHLREVKKESGGGIKSEPFDHVEING